MTLRQAQGRTSVQVHHGDCVAWLLAYAEAIARGEAAAFDAVVCDPPYHLTSIVKRFGQPGAAPAKKGKAANATGAYARASKGFMGKTWDGGDVAFRPETWAAVLACMKPGAHLVAFSGTRTYHRMACAIEDAGFEIRDQLKFDYSLSPLWDELWASLQPWQAELLSRLLDGMTMEGQLAWAYGSGFPKSHDVSKAIDKAAGAERAVVGKTRHPDGRARNLVERLSGVHEGGQRANGVGLDVTAPATDEAAEWQGWGTALKPSWEPICLARAPLSEKSVAANVLKWGTGALNIDGCRIGDTVETWPSTRRNGAGDGRTCARGSGEAETVDTGKAPLGRWPANLCHDGSDEVAAAFPESKDGVAGSRSGTSKIAAVGLGGYEEDWGGYGGQGSAARFFYSAKAGPLDRLGSEHATVKPVDLMRWLVRMVCPPGGLVLDPFAGSGTTGIAAMAEGFDATLIELEADHVADIERKLALLRGESAGLIAEHINRREIERAKEKAGRQPALANGQGSIFGEMDA